MTATLETLREQVRSCLEGGEVERAADACLRGLRQYPRWVEGHRFLGEINLSQDALDAARHCFELVASAQPDNATPYVGIGVVMEHQQRFAEAVVAFERALDLDQSDNEVRQELVRLYSQLRVSRGVQTTRAALAHQHVHGHMLRQAQSEIDGLLDGAPQRLDLMLARARVAWLSGKLDLAERYARAVLDVSPDCVLANLIVGESLSRSGNSDEAEPFLQAVRELDPEAQLSSIALQDLLAEGATIASGMPAETRPAPFDESQADEALADEARPRPDALAHVTPDSGTGAIGGQEWASTSADLPGQGATSAALTHAGMLDGLLKDLDQVWPERLDLGDATSSHSAPGTTSPEPLPDLAPVDDEELPPSFLGDVSEVIREFEDPTDHYDLFADMPNQQAGDVPGGASLGPAAGTVLAETAATPLDFAAEVGVSGSRSQAHQEDLTVSGQHAIIDLSILSDDAWGAAASDDVPAVTGHDVEGLLSSERSVIDLSLDDAEAASRASDSVLLPALGIASHEASGSGERAVIDLDAHEYGSLDAVANGDTGPSPTPFDLATVPTPTEEDLADLLCDPVATGVSVEAEAHASTDRSPDDGPADDAWADANHGATAEHLLLVTEPPVVESEDGEAAWAPTSEVESQHAEGAEAIPAGPSAESALAEVQEALAGGRFDHGWKHLQVVVRDTPAFGEKALELLADHDGGSDALRLQVSGDALMASGRFWDALARYSDALAAVRQQRPAR